MTAPNSTDLATLTDVKARLDWTLDDSEERMAEAALEDASDLARFYGLDAWQSVEVTPRTVRTLVLQAVVQYMRNPEGYIQSRAGDETVIWAEGEAKGASRGAFAFNPEQIETLKDLAGKGKANQFFGSVEVSAWGTVDRCVPGVGYVPTSDTTAFPFFSDPVSPW